MAKKYLYLNTSDGEHYEEEAIDESAGAADAGKIPALDADGVLDPSIINAATTGNEVVLMTGATGRIDEAVMPIGFGTDAKMIQASEAISGNDVVNIHVVGSDFRVRRADASNGRAANGFVKTGVAMGEQALVYREGNNDGVSGLTSPKVFLATTPGGVTSTPPSGAGQILQRIGTADSATSFYFSWNAPTHLVG